MDSQKTGLVGKLLAKLYKLNETSGASSQTHDPRSGNL